MDRLQRIKREIRSAEDCAVNQALTPGTRRQCRDEVMDLQAILQEAVSLAAMHRKMAETSLSDKGCVDMCRPCEHH
eukprot:7390846-Prymnesium_polylepis.2